MSPKQLIFRFKQMKHDYIGHTSRLKTLWYIFDYMFSLLIYGASISDYFAYGFYKLRPAGRNEYITYRRFRKILRIANKKNDIHLCRNKIDFNTHFSKYLGREWVDTKTVSKEELLLFMQKHPIIFAKDIMGFRGDGVSRIDTTKTPIDTLLYNITNQEDAHYILEEPLSEIEELLEFHPSSINTLRIVTLYDAKHDAIHVISACFRMGNNNYHVDNFHYDGIAANIHIESGIINSMGYDKHNRLYTHHPISKKKIIGTSIPHWDTCIQVVKEAAKQIPSICYIGWDVVINKHGKICLIEANDNADHDIQQLHNKGLWKEYKRFLHIIK